MLNPDPIFICSQCGKCREPAKGFGDPYIILQLEKPDLLKKVSCQICFRMIGSSDDLIHRVPDTLAAGVPLDKMNTYIDIRKILPSIHVPTLVIHRTGDIDVNVGNGRYLARNIHGAKYVELPGEDHVLWVGDTDSVADEIEEFLTGTRSPRQMDRVLATILLTDIARSTERAKELGDNEWKKLLLKHNEIVAKELKRFRGRAIKSTGDGFLCTFDGPARAINFACSIRDNLHQLGISIRAGLHTGECELIGDNDIGGVNVHIAARVESIARANEVLVSSTVKDLVSGSGIKFDDLGLHPLKGISERWRLFRVSSS